MFYSSTPSIINDNSSYLHSRHVFTGQYWDEFALTGFFVPEKAKVLMLGLSLGGGVRPILSANKSIDLTCVDFDPTTTKRCEKFYRDHFPQLNFNVTVCDAEQFLETSNETYDCIWLDIYLGDAYSSLFFSSRFYQLIKKNLTPKGQLLVNAYGLPNQFQPLTRGGVQFQIAQILQQQFCQVAAIPYRRNITFVATEGEFSVYPCSPRPELSPLDRAMFQSVGLKARYIECLPNPLVSSYTETEDTSQFKNLDGRMRGLWGEVLSEVKKYGYDLDTPGQLLKFVEDESAMVKLLDLALEDDSMLMTAIPILCSGESHLHKLNVHWLFNWFMENAQQMRIKNLTLYRQIWLPQIFAMIAQTSGQFRQHYFRALSLLQREVL